MYRIKQSSDGQFYNILIGTNGKVLSQCETEKTHASVVKNIKAQMRRLRTYDNLIEIIDETRNIRYKIKLLQDGSFTGPINQKPLRKRDRHG